MKNHRLGRWFFILYIGFGFSMIDEAVVTNCSDINKEAVLPAAVTSAIKQDADNKVTAVIFVQIFRRNIFCLK